MVRQRFGSSTDFLQRVNPGTQASFANNPAAAVMGDYPTLLDIDNAYGKLFAAEWLIPQLDNLSMYTGTKNITEEQQRELAIIIATEYGYMKITEMLMFFHRFKSGRYGRFYGNVDPMVVTCALQEFANERNELRYNFEQEKRQKEIEEQRKRNPPPITRQEWERMKQQKQQNQKP